MSWLRIQDHLHSVHSENAGFGFLLPRSGTCFRSCLDKSGKQGASIASSRPAGRANILISTEMQT